MVRMAVLGTGLLGSGFALRGLDNGHEVRVWNRTAAKCVPLVEQGAVHAQTPAQAVLDCQRVHLVLKADDAVDEVIDQFRDHLAPGAWIVDHSTNLPARVTARCERLRKANLRYIHAPVFMGPAHSRMGTGQMLISGPQAAIAELTPALEEMTGTLTVVGARDQDAAVQKILGNGLIIGISGLAGDLLATGRAAGLTDETIIAAMGFSPMAQRMARRVAEHGQAETTFTLAMARKDVGLLVASAGAEAMCMLPGLAAAMDMRIANGQGDQQYTAVAVPR